MKITTIRLQNFRSFVDSGIIELGQVNVIIGKNNSGKSTILRGIQNIQQGMSDIYADVRNGTPSCTIELALADDNGFPTWGCPNNYNISLQITHFTTDHRSGSTIISIQAPDFPRRDGDFRFPAVEPSNFIVPYLSKRKAAHYDENTRLQEANAVSTNVGNLAAKLARLGNSSYPRHSAYADACKSILGFTVTAIPSQSGQRPGVYLPDESVVWIDQMGDGVPNIVQLLANLATSSGKLFLIEEPENDLHPTALKSLLNLVAESSKSNQFVVSTHSNIVARYLGSIPNSRLLQVRPEHENVLPITAKVEAIEARSDARMLALEDLGYSLTDFDLWDGWLILEESSAERIIRDYIIPWFAPTLSRVKTVSAGGVDKVEPLFEDFQRMVLYTHLSPAYRWNTWVRVDGDKPGNYLIEKLKSNFEEWPAGRFSTFSMAQFENYYPKHFSADVIKTLSITNKQERRNAKRELLRCVVHWLDEDRERGKAALQESAAEIISDLQTIESTFSNGQPTGQSDFKQLS